MADLAVPPIRISKKSPTVSPTIYGVCLIIDMHSDYICDRIKLLSIYIESNIATISNDVGLCFRLGQISNGSKVVRFSIKLFGEISFFKMHFAKS